MSHKELAELLDRLKSADENDRWFYVISLFEALVALNKPEPLSLRRANTRADRELRARFAVRDAK